MAEIVIAAALVVRDDGKTLLVRKHGTTAAAAEIDAIAWISVNTPPHIPMAPPTEYLILPLDRQLLPVGQA